MREAAAHPKRLREEAKRRGVAQKWAEVGRSGSEVDRKWTEVGPAQK